MTKSKLRKALLERLKHQKEEDRRRKSSVIRRKLFRLTAFREATMVCCYVSLPYEVQTWQMIEAMLSKGKRVAVPVTQKQAKRLQLCEVHDLQADLKPGAFGVWEPVSGSRQSVRFRDVDLVLVPGVAFDSNGNRLGHGKGYYDRFLAGLPKDTPTIGLAYAFQVVDQLPTQTHDHVVGKVLSA